MSSRLLSVTARTTLDYVETVVRGHEFETESVAVVNATSDRDDPDRVELQLEVDGLDVEGLPAHAEVCGLTPDQARALAADLEEHAERVERSDAEPDR